MSMGSPVSPSPFHKVLQVLGNVQTNEGIITITLGFLFLIMLFVVFFMTGQDRLLAGGGVLLAIVVFALLRTHPVKDRDGSKDGK